MGVLCSWGRDVPKILYAWLGAVIAYFYVFTGAISGHIYYHLPLLPVAALFFGFGVQWLLDKQSFFKKMLKNQTVVWLGGGLVFLILAAYMEGSYLFFKYMYENRMPYTMEAAKIIREHFPKNSFMILDQPKATPGVETYYSHTRSWDFLAVKTAIPELERLRSLGAASFVAIDTKYGSGVLGTKNNVSFWQYLNEKYKPIVLTDHYLIFDLRVPLATGGKK